MDAGIGNSSAAGSPWFIDVQVLDRAVLTNQPGDMLPGDLCVFGAKKYVGANVIDPGSQSFHSYEGLVGAQAQILGVFGKISAL